jgi:hypothetical protein
VASRGKKTIGPRPELVQEILAKTEIETFYMYNSERFSQFAGERLGVKIGKGSVEQVGDIARAYSRATSPTVRKRAEEAVRVWLSTKFDVVAEPGGFPDFTCANAGSDSLYGFEVIYSEGVNRLAAMLNGVLGGATKELAESRFTELTFVAVLPDEERARIANRLFCRKMKVVLASRVRLLTGFVSGDPPEFVPTGGSLGQ